jgi:hypothetical protein
MSALTVFGSGANSVTGCQKMMPVGHRLAAGSRGGLAGHTAVGVLTAEVLKITI